jgi:TIR domain
VGLDIRQILSSSRHIVLLSLTTVMGGARLSGKASHARHRTVTAPSIERTAALATDRPLRVFISYAHEDTRQKAQVAQLCLLLRACEIDAVIDTFYDHHRQDWFAWMLTHIPRADFAIVIASPQYAELGDGGIADHSRGIQNESAILRDLFYGNESGWRDRILPVILPGGSPKHIPRFLQPNCRHRYHVRSLTLRGIDELLRALTNDPLPPPPLGQAADLAGVRGLTRPWATGGHTGMGHR